jgi:hypothetical protein
VLLQQLVISANVHIHTLVLTVKVLSSHELLYHSVLALFAHVHNPLLQSSIHVYQIHVKIAVVVLLFTMLLDAIAHLASLVTTVNLVSEISFIYSFIFLIE